VIFVIRFALHRLVVEVIAQVLKSAAYFTGRALFSIAKNNANAVPLALLFAQLLVFIFRFEEK